MNAGVISSEFGGHARGNWEELPEELIFIIIILAGIADARTVANAALVCKRWHKQAVQERLWKHIYLARWMPPPRAERTSSWRLQHSRLKALRTRDLSLEGFLPTHGYVNAICVLPLPSPHHQRQHIAPFGADASPSDTACGPHPAPNDPNLTKSPAAFLGDNVVDIVAKVGDYQASQGAGYPGLSGEKRPPSCLVVVASEVDEHHGPGGLRIFDPQDWVTQQLPDPLNRPNASPGGEFGRPTPRMYFLPREHSRGAVCLAPLPGRLLFRPGGHLDSGPGDRANHGRISDEFVVQDAGGGGAGGSGEEDDDIAALTCFVSGSRDGLVRVWEAHPRPQCLAILGGHEGEVTAVAALPGDRFPPLGSPASASGPARGAARQGAVLHHVLASASRDKTVRIWCGVTVDSAGTGAATATGGPSSAVCEGWSASRGHSSGGTGMVAANGGANFSARRCHFVCVRVLRGHACWVSSLVFLDTWHAGGQGGDARALVAAPATEGHWAVSASVSSHDDMARAGEPNRNKVQPAETNRSLQRESNSSRIPANNQHDHRDRRGFVDGERQTENGGDLLDRAMLAPARAGCQLSHAGTLRDPGFGDRAQQQPSPPLPVILASSDGEGKLRLWDVSALIPTSGWHGDEAEEKEGAITAAVGTAFAEGNTMRNVSFAGTGGVGAPIAEVSAAAILAAIADEEPLVPGFIAAELHVPALLSLPSPEPVAVLAVSAQHQFCHQGPRDAPPSMTRGTQPPWHRAVRCLAAARMRGAPAGAGDGHQHPPFPGVPDKPLVEAIIAGCNDGKVYTWPALPGVGPSPASHGGSTPLRENAGGAHHGDRGTIPRVPGAPGMVTAAVAAVPSTTAGRGVDSAASRMNASQPGEMGTANGDFDGEGHASSGQSGAHIAEQSGRQLAGLSMSHHSDARHDLMRGGVLNRLNGMDSSDFSRTGKSVTPVCQVSNTPRGHTSWVLCAYTVGDLLITGSQDGSIVVSDLASGEPLRQQSIGGVVSCLGLLGEHVLVGTGGADTSGVWLYRIPM